MSEPRSPFERWREAAVARYLNRIRNFERQAVELSMNTRITPSAARQFIQEHGLAKARQVAQLIQLGWNTDRAIAMVTRGPWSEEAIDTYIRFGDTGFLSQSWDPSSITLPEQPKSAPSKPCYACANYVGATQYSETGERRPEFVCAMHPYGPESETCEDWEARFRSVGERVWDESLGQTAIRQLINLTGRVVQIYSEIGNGRDGFIVLGDPKPHLPLGRFTAFFEMGGFNIHCPEAEWNEEEGCIDLFLIAGWTTPYSATRVDRRQGG